MTGPPGVKAGRPDLIRCSSCGIASTTPGAPVGKTRASSCCPVGDQARIPPLPPSATTEPSALAAIAPAPERFVTFSTKSVAGARSAPSRTTRLPKSTAMRPPGSATNPAIPVGSSSPGSTVSALLTSSPFGTLQRRSVSGPAVISVSPSAVNSRLTLESAFSGRSSAMKGRSAPTCSPVAGFHMRTGPGRTCASPSGMSVSEEAVASSVPSPLKAMSVTRSALALKRIGGRSPSRAQIETMPSSCPTAIGPPFGARATSVIVAPSGRIVVTADPFTTP